MMIKFSLFLFAAISASACYVYVPLEVRVAKATFIVEGEITGTDEKDKRVTGTLKVTDVLKGDPATAELEMVWSAPYRGPGIIADGPVRYKKGQKGLWILTERKDWGLMASYPGDFSSDAKAVERTKAAITKLKKMEWKKAGNLEWAVLTELHLNAGKDRQGKPTLGRGQFFPLVRNVSKDQQHLFYFMPHQPLKASLKGPDGKELPIKNGNPNPKAKVSAYAFKAIAPGQLESLGYGMQFPAFRESGEYTLTLNYENNEHDGTAFKKENVFKGKVEVTTKVAIPGEG